MCLYPKLLKNKKYTATEKNRGVIPPLPLNKEGKPDKRVLLTAVGCGQCERCMKRKAREWSTRLQEEIKENKNAHFITLTFNTEELQKLSIGIRAEGYELDNAIAKKAVKLWRERYRKHKKKSPRHWLVTEIGGGRYEHMHIHGIVFGDIEEIKKHWGYGYIYVGEYCNEKTINYIVKYLHKEDEKHKTYKPVILTSPGIGKGYIGSIDARRNQYKAGETNEAYKTKSGAEINLNVYYRNKIYTEEEREKLWQEKLDSGIMYVNGQKVNANNDKLITKLLEQGRRESIKKGYSNGDRNWDRREYENNRRLLIHKERLRKEKTDKKKKP